MNLDARTGKKTDALPGEGQILENGLLMPEHMKGLSKKWARALKQAWISLVNGVFYQAKDSYTFMARLYYRGPRLRVDDLMEADPELTLKEAKKLKAEDDIKTREEWEYAEEFYERFLKLAYRATGGPH